MPGDDTVSKRAAFCLAMIFLAGLLTGCQSLFTDADDDCGYSVAILKSSNESSYEIVFSQVIAEVLNGKRNCGFGYIPLRVGKPMMDGKPLEEVERNRQPAYRFVGNFDPGSTSITFMINETNYLAAPEPSATPSDSFHRKARKFPPK
jgi:hypothetical protein